MSRNPAPSSDEFHTLARIFSSYMNKYRCLDWNCLQRAIYKDNKDEAISLLLICKEKKLEKRMHEIAVLAQRPYVAKSFQQLSELALEYPGYQDSAKYHEVDISVCMIEKWCGSQGIPIEKFVNDVRNIIDKKTPGVNCLYLLGESNAGKTLIAASIAEACVHFASACVGAGNLEYLGFVGARVGYLENYTTSLLGMKVFRKLLAGEEVEVDVPSGGKQKVTRVPIVMATNRHFTEKSLCQSQKEIANRYCIIYQVTKQKWLGDFSGKLHPGAWSELIKKYVHNQGDQEMSASAAQC